jgi:hypothetical protein
MAAPASKSKKQSAASSRLLPRPFVFFTDANLGRHIVPDALRAAGEQVRVHDEEFEPGTADGVAGSGRRGRLGGLDERLEDSIPQQRN